LQKKTVSDAEKFAKSSDMQDLPYIKDVNTEKGTEDYYNMMLLMLDQRITENEIALKEAQKNQDAKAVKLNTCLVGCAKAERTRWENLKTEHIRILKQYKNDDDKRDEKINEFMMQTIQVKPCNCE